MSSAKLRTLRSVLFCRSFICIKNNNGPNTEPCGTPEVPQGSVAYIAPEIAYIHFFNRVTLQSTIFLNV